MSLNSKFDELKQFYLNDFGKIFQLSGMSGIFLECKIDLRDSNIEFM